MVNDRWSRKIVALLHDPPDKPFGISEHKGRAAELQGIALGRDATVGEHKLAEQADWIASAADRVDFPEKDSREEYLSAYWQKEKAVLTHPLAGRQLDLGSLADVRTSQTHEAAKRALQNLLNDVSDPQRRFLGLWRSLPDALASELPRVGKLFGILPADTRQPDHPLMEHLFITAAIANALPQPALLVFSIGPVQEFIAAARRTQDLWMGSWLLSYLSWTAIRSLAEDYGPDVIIFPSLRGQPLCDLWLHQQGVNVQKPDAEALGFASLPNKFVALLPASEAKSAAEKAKQAVCDEWRRLTDEVLKALASGVMPADQLTRQMWQEQITTQLEVYWSTLPWAGDGKSDGKVQADAVKSLFEALCDPSPDWHFGKVYALFAKPKEEGGGQYHPNWGTTYSLLYTLADRAFNARKVLRDFQPAEERGEKCTVCGQRAALHGQAGGRQGVRRFWGQTTQQVQAESQKKGSLFEGHYTALRTPDEKGEGRERLCAVCTIKRFVQPAVLASKFGLKGGFPSTSEVAVASFKEGILKKLSDPKDGEKLSEALQDHLEKLELLVFPKTVAKNAIPKLHRLRHRLSNASPQAREYAAKLLDYGGEAFFIETFTPRRLKEEYNLDEVSERDAEAVRGSLKKLIKVAEEVGITRPAKYYAALMMDGDRAGQWLSGTHDRLARLGDVLHPKVFEQLKDLDGWKELLNERRLMTPAVHAAISDALANFALKLVQFIVEERRCGRVVYAGGDDVLALLPLDNALSAARELRALFSGHLKHEKAIVDFDHDEDLPVDLGDEEASGYLVYRQSPSREILLTMGPTATASIGIAVAHHLHPLDATLQAMREAEHAAKELYERNALCIHLLKRSGEEARMGAQWVYRANGEVIDTVALVNGVRIHFIRGLRNEKGLSMKFAHAVFEEARTLAQVDLAAQEAELHRLISRHSTGFDNREERQAFAKSLSRTLVGLAAQLQKHRDRWQQKWSERYGDRVPLPADEVEAPQPSIVQLANWLLLARFLAQGGEE